MNWFSDVIRSVIRPIDNLEPRVAALEGLEPRVAALEALKFHVASLERKLRTIMATLQQIVDEVTIQTSTVASLAAFVQGLQAQLAAVPGLTPAQQTQIDGIFAAIDANTKTVAAAIVANVPPGPVPAPPVPPVV